MRLKITCCKDCPDRVLGCHSTCERYIEQSAERKAQNDLIYENRMKDSEQRERVILAKRKAMRRR